MAREYILDDGRSTDVCYSLVQRRPIDAVYVPAELDAGRADCTARSLTTTTLKSASRSSGVYFALLERR